MKRAEIDPAQAVAREVPGEVRYVVTCHLVVARTPRGGDNYRYRGAGLPPDTDPIQVEALLRDGLIRPITPEHAPLLRQDSTPPNTGTNAAKTAGDDDERPRHQRHDIADREF